MGVLIRRGDENTDTHRGGTPPMRTWGEDGIYMLRREAYCQVKYYYPMVLFLWRTLIPHLFSIFSRSFGITFKIFLWTLWHDTVLHGQ